MSNQLNNWPAVRIPPMEANARSDSYYTLAGGPARILSFQPHMHYRGKRQILEAIMPDGRIELLSDVPRYDWRWQITYTYKHPPVFPRGTVLHVTTYHDNSPANKENPDPTAFVGWGERTVDEMNNGWTDFYYISDEEYEAAVKQQAPGAFSQQENRQVIGRLGPSRASAAPKANPR